MHRRMRTRLWTAITIGLVAALAACGGGDGGDQAAPPSTTPVVTPDISPIPLETGDAAMESPFASGAVPEKVAEGYGLVWNDEFTGTALGADWAFRDKQAANRACSPPAAEQTEVRGGSVHLSVIRDPSKTPNVTKACPDGQYLNAMIGTDNTQRFRYGIFAARIKFHAEQGAHGSFWMQPKPPTGADPADPAQRGVEIDVIEYFGKGWVNGGLASFIHFQPPGGKRIRSGGYLQAASDALKGELPSDDYHVYSVEWTEKEYVFRVDGIETLRTSKAVSKVPQYFILSLLSSDYEIPKITDDVLPLTMSVDWVRAWQQ
jgi:beta-glucanase (GH16 family)